MIFEFTAKGGPPSMKVHNGKHEESYHSASSHSLAVGQAIMSAPRRLSEVDADSAEEGEEGEDPKCFIENTLLEDLHGRYVKVELLDVMDQVLGCSGRAVRVLSKHIHPAENQDLVELHAGEARLERILLCRESMARGAREFLTFFESLGNFYSIVYTVLFLEILALRGARIFNFFQLLFRIQYVSTVLYIHYCIYSTVKFP